MSKNTETSVSNTSLANTLLAEMGDTEATTAPTETKKATSPITKKVLKEVCKHLLEIVCVDNDEYCPDNTDAQYAFLEIIEELKAMELPERLQKHTEIVNELKKTKVELEVANEKLKKYLEKDAHKLKVRNERREAKKNGTYVPKRGGKKKGTALSEEEVRRIAQEEAKKATESKRATHPFFATKPTEESESEESEVESE